MYIIITKLSVTYPLNVTKKNVIYSIKNLSRLGWINMHRRVQDFSSGGAMTGFRGPGGME